MKAVLLDALGTLVRLEPPAPALAGALGVPDADAERAIAAEIAYYRAHLDEGRDAVSLARLRRSCAAVVRDTLALPREEDLTEVLLSCIRFSAFDDVRPALAQLRADGCRLVVVSNWDFSLHEVLDRVGLRPLLDGVVTSAETGARKPAREMFERGLELADVAASAAIHVGDSLAEDVEGARTAGIEPVLVVRESGAPTPPGVRAISSLLDLTSSK